MVARKNIESNDVNIRYFDNQKLPDVNASVNYGAQAIGGVGLLRGPSSGLVPGPITGTVERSYWDTLGTVFAGDFPGWTLSLDMAYPIGKSTQEAQLARARLQKTQAERQLSSLELAVTTQVRDAARNVQTNAKRVDATRSSRVLAERRLEAEEKKYQAGMTQNFFVLQAQRDLERRAQQRAARAGRICEVGGELLRRAAGAAPGNSNCRAAAQSRRHGYTGGRAGYGHQSSPSTRRRTSRPPSSPSPGPTRSSSSTARVPTTPSRSRGGLPIA